MINLEAYRNESGRININLAENDGLIDIDRNPQHSIIGAREKYWCHTNGQDILFKKTLDMNYEDISELVGSEIAKLIDLPCAEYDLAEFNGQIGVITEDFVGGNEELVSGSEILDEVNTFHIYPIQMTCYKYYMVKNAKDFFKTKEEYIEALIEIYDSCILKTLTMNTLILSYKSGDIIDLNMFVFSLHNYFDEISQLYDYRFVGFSSKNITQAEKDRNKMYDDYFHRLGNTMNGWNKNKKVVVSNNLFDIWSMIDSYCLLNNYSCSPGSNIMMDLIKMFIYDIICNQGDRHISNWSLLVDQSTSQIKFAPIYDNSKICGLDERKSLIAEKAHGIDKFYKQFDKLSEEKRQRSAKYLKNSINNHAESKLMIEYQDNYDRKNKFQMLEKLIRISDDSVLQLVKYIIEKINVDSIKSIFETIEQKHKITIPNEVKIVIIATIDFNTQEITNIINGFEERSVKK